MDAQEAIEVVGRFLEQSGMEGRTRVAEAWNVVLRARREALEEAAKVCEEMRSSEPYDPERGNDEMAYRECADAIRDLISPAPS